MPCGNIHMLASLNVGLALWGNRICGTSFFCQMFPPAGRVLKQMIGPMVNHPARYWIPHLGWFEVPQFKTISAAIRSSCQSMPGHMGRLTLKRCRPGSSTCLAAAVWNQCGLSDCWFFSTNFGNLWHKSWCVWERTTVSGSELVRLVESPKISEKCDCIILFCKTRPANFSHFFGQTVHSWLARLAFVTVSPNGKERFRWKAVWVSKGCFPSTQKCFEKACHTTLYV